MNANVVSIIQIISPQSVKRLIETRKIDVFKNKCLTIKWKQ